MLTVNLINIIQYLFGYQSTLTHKTNKIDSSLSVCSTHFVSGLIKKQVQGWISQRVRTGPNLGLVLGEIQIAWIVLS